MIELYFIDSLKKNFFAVSSIKIWRIISKATPPLLLICFQNSNVDYVKPIL